jgi:hypothetical protein
VFVCEITSQTNKRGALIGPTNQQVVANTVCWFIEHPGCSELPTQNRGLSPKRFLKPSDNR